MAPFGIFRRKKKEQAQQAEQKTLLEELCRGDKELYEALNRTIMLNPDMAMKEGIDLHLQRAQEFESAGDTIRARIAYQTAGEISLYEGKLAQAQKFFKKAAEVDPENQYRKAFDYYIKKENAERALTVAQEFYNKKGKRAVKK